jgi:hypothetical protein
MLFGSAATTQAQAASSSGGTKRPTFLPYVKVGHSALSSWLTADVRTSPFSCPVTYALPRSSEVSSTISLRR